MNNKSLLKTFIESAHRVTTLILQSLSVSLGLHPTESASTAAEVLPALHRKLEPSPDSMTFIKYPQSSPTPSKQPLASHTDYGSLTLVFPDGPGLQLLVPDPAGGPPIWQNIDPKPGHAIVNCGDALSLLTGNVIRSNIHRVASQLERQSKGPRYTLGYFLRPSDHVILAPLKGDMIPPVDSGHDRSLPKGDGESARAPPTTKEWVQRRYQSRLLAQYKGAETWAETTGTERQALETRLG